MVTQKKNQAYLLTMSFFFLKTQKMIAESKKLKEQIKWEVFYDKEFTITLSLIF